ncbi:transcriptional regulator [Bradyrhizobium guangdongense]|uniref:ATP-binding protein n=1 Tax=Bradyrhizobium guangdongense TaxID=1325090 RepID=UPI00112AFD12|nr:AAA family ATPase [Bradyrhizobium guangdongense]TPQ30999.1 transcriptional regulator [Bradyrhizobium guangdongense]
MATIHAFGPFRLDAEANVLFRDGQPVALGQRAVALLRILVERPGALVSKDDLIEAAWSGLAVEESNLSVQISALRRALGEAGGADWIETMPRRGYRFVGPTVRLESAHAALASSPSPRRMTQPAAGDGTTVRDPHETPSQMIVGRTASLEALDRMTESVLAGRRQVAFVTGEAGIGKTAFIAKAVERLKEQGFDLLSGRCTERFGIDDVFQSPIDALAARCRAPDGHDLLATIRTHAPTWMLQIPDAIDASERAAVRDEVFGATRERMVREFCELVEAMSARQPWVVVLEDLHWSDLATLDVLSRFARGTAAAPVLVIGSYRPADSVIDAHPIRRLHQDLEIHGLCARLALEPLARDDVEHYLALRFRDPQLASALSEPVFERTHGQPLFVTSLVKHFIDLGAVVETDGTWHLALPAAITGHDIPDDLLNMITHEIGRLTEDERRLVDAASVAGLEFSASLVAAGLSRDAIETERQLEALARKDHLLVRSGAGEWPDGTYSGTYAFRHNLYQNVVYRHLAPGLRAQTHHRLGKRLEEAYRGRAAEIASTLALHFEQGRDFPSALRYLGQAAENSTRRLGHEEAINYLSRALAILDRIGTSAQDAVRMAFLRQRSWARRSAGDLAGSVDDLRQVIALTAAAGELRQEVGGLLAVSRFTLHADRRVCLQASDEALAKSEALADDAFKAMVQGSSASTNLWLKGWDARDAALCEEALRVTAGARDHSTLIRRCGIEGILECLRARYEACRQTGTDGKRLAQEVGDVYVFVLFNSMESTALIHLGQWRRLQRETIAALALAEKNANPPAIALCRLALAWLHVEAMDFAGARDLCEGVDEGVLAENPFAFFYQRAVLAKAFVGLNEPQRAKNQFDSVQRRLDSDAIMLDYTIYAQLHHCLGEYGLRTGDIALARRAADELYAYVARAPDLNHLAQAHGLRARIAVASGDRDEALANLTTGFSIVDKENFPLAAWRVYDSAAEVFTAIGDVKRAATYRNRFADVIRTLADNFAPDDRLHKSLMAALATRMADGSRR